MYLMRDYFVHLYADVSFLSQLPFIICFLEAGVRVIENGSVSVKKKREVHSQRICLEIILGHC